MGSSLLKCRGLREREREKERERNTLWRPRGTFASVRRFVCFFPAISCHTILFNGGYTILLVYLWTLARVPPGGATVAEQTDRILQNLMTNYKVDVHPETEDDGAVSVKVEVMPLHLVVVITTINY